EKNDASLLREVSEGEVVVPRKGGSRQQIEQRLPDVGRRCPVAQHLVLGKVRLELDGVGSGFRRRGHQLGRERDVAVVVDARLRDDEATLARPNRAARDRHPFLSRHQVLTGVRSKKRFCVYNSTSTSRSTICWLASCRK